MHTTQKGDRCKENSAPSEGQIRAQKFKGKPEGVQGTVSGENNRGKEQPPVKKIMQKGTGNRKDKVTGEVVREKAFHGLEGRTTKRDHSERRSITFCPRVERQVKCSSKSYHIISKGS